jgi:hypothetical protein
MNYLLVVCIMIGLSAEDARAVKVTISSSFLGVDGIKGIGIALVCQGGQRVYTILIDSTHSLPENTKQRITRIFESITGRAPLPHDLTFNKPSSEVSF